MKNTKKKGISLIVLVITIIVMIILAAAIVVSISNSNVFQKAIDMVGYVRWTTKGYSYSIFLVCNI